MMLLPHVYEMVQRTPHTPHMTYRMNFYTFLLTGDLYGGEECCIIVDESRDHAKRENHVICSSIC